MNSRPLDPAACAAATEQATAAGVVAPLPPSPCRCALTCAPNATLTAIAVVVTNRFILMGLTLTGAPQGLEWRVAIAGAPVAWRQSVRLPAMSRAYLRSTTE